VNVRLTGDGAQDPAFSELLARFPLATGDVAEHVRWEAGKKSLQDLAAERGYLEAGFESKALIVDLDRYAAAAEAVFVTGPRYRFGAVIFHQEVLDPALLEVYPRFRRGDPFELAPLLRLQEELAANPAFRWVEVSPRLEAPEGLEVPIDVYLEPAPRRRWTLGAGYGTDTGARGRTSLELRRLNPRGHRLAADLRVSEREQRLTATYMVPARFPRSEVLSLSVRLAGLNPSSSESDLGSVAGRLTRTRGRWTESLGLVFQRERFEAGADSGTADLVMPEAGWTIGHADDLIYPTRGWRFQASARGASGSLLSDVSFLQARLDGRLVRALGSRNRVLLRAVVAHSAVDDFSRLPASLRFFAGGDGSVRGFGYQELGPVDDEGRMSGGDSLLEASVEVDRLLVERWGRWGLAAFFDAGNSLRSFSGSLERGVGIGVRWLSPVGMIRADVAAAVSRPGRPLRFHLSMGSRL
jgi:translocation and assembly module TamA